MKIALTVGACVGLLASLTQATTAFNRGDRDLAEAYALVGCWQFLAVTALWGVYQ